MEVEKRFSEDLETANNLNNGLADVMHKILKTRKPKRKKTIVLAKAKKLSKKTIVTLNNENNADEVLNKIKNSDWILKGRIKPNPLGKNYEKRLLKITTSGVVNLFNAVNKYKNNIGTSGPLVQNEHLKVIDKNNFLGLLSNRPSSLNKENLKTDKVEVEGNEKQNNSTEIWDVLKKDFGNNTKWKNWDKTLYRK